MTINTNIDKRLEFPATQRNRYHIAEILKRYLPTSGCILEIASGSGEHGVLFQQLFPSLIWQTSDPNPRNRQSICSWIIHQNLSLRMPNPIDIDVENRPWPLTSELKSKLKGIVCINMIHISPWTCTQSLFEQAGSLLMKDEFLMIYGPFIRKDHPTSQSNLLFDESLKRQNPIWGIRDIESVNQIAISNGFKNNDIIEMPANNHSLVFRRN